MTQQEITPELVARYHRAINVAHYVLLPDGKRYIIMWRWADQFGVRNHETGAQFAFTYEDAMKHGLMPLILCPVDLNNI